MYPKRIVITGASSGIGRASALLFAENGYEVIGLSRSIEEKTERIGNGSIRGIKCDVTDEESVRRAISLAGDFAIILHSAGFGIAGSAEDTPLEEVRKQFETNYFGVLRINSEALKVLRKHDRSLVMVISSIAGRVPIPFQSHYSSTKYALEAYLMSLRMEAKDLGVRCVLIEPGDVSTGFTSQRRSFFSDTYREKAMRAISQMEKDERNGMKAEDIARAAYRMTLKGSVPARTAIGLKYKALMFIMRFLPDRAVLFILSRLYHV